MGVTIFHNPNCGTSRNVLAALQAADLKPTVVDYLKTGWTKPQLKALLAEMKAQARDTCFACAGRRPRSWA